MNNLPPALRPIYTTDEPNKNVVLYQGSLELCSNTNRRKVQVPGTGKIEYVWFPSPRIQFSFSNQEPHISDILIAHVNNNPTSLDLLDIGVSSIEVIITSSTSGGNNGNFVSGRVENSIIQGNDQDLAYVLFHVVNFHDFRGGHRSILEQESRLRFMERLVFETDGWKITLDQLETTTDNVKLLNVQGGFAITHIGKLEKLDETTFLADEGREFLKIFSDFLSFARGFYVSLVLLTGYNTEEEKLWEYWEQSEANSWRSIRSWNPKDKENQLTRLFPGFLAWRENWEESERLVLGWYLEANYNPLAEQNILIAQIALELIAWVLIVEKDKTISKVGFDKLPASDKLRILFSKFGIPLGIPYSNAFLKELQQLASQENWVDGSHAFTSMRNAIVHPETKKRNRIYNASPMAKTGAAFLGLWYLELILLALFNYQGSYSNRLNQATLTNVPWSD